jgi:precorrin-6A/cobalt-precorrin-6A reductase
VTARTVLLLAGTTEAAELAERLAGRAETELVVSLAGHTRSPAALPGRLRTGGFGGVDGLVAELRRSGYDRLVDATHPFADRMPGQAAAAAAIAGVARVRLLRPPWQPVPGDDWHEVADLAGAAGRLAELSARRVFLTTGRLGLSAFEGLTGTAFVARSIEAPTEELLPDLTTILARGPFTVEAERALLVEHRIDTMVTKNSGGDATAAKLTAARQLGIPVVMVQRPPAPAGPVVTTADAALRWIEAPERSLIG